MDKCACTGIRSCKLCENLEATRIRLETAQAPSQSKIEIRKYFPSDSELENLGAFVFERFITEEEEENLSNYMDSGQWIPSQSGRRKQDFGPKANFKRKKAKLGNFKGIPAIMTPIFERLKSVDSVMESYEPVECLFLEYTAENGAHIDPHLDDSWLWARFSNKFFLKFYESCNT